MSANREIHSMIFSSLHLPPMPVVVQQIDRDDSSVVSDHAVESSHDILAGLMDYASGNMSPRENNNRKALQMELVYNFYEELESIPDPDSLSDEAVYQFYAKHTQAWMRAYTMKLNNHLASFKPYDYVAVGDKIHAQTQEYAKAQCYLTSEGKSEVEIDPRVPYCSVLRMCAKILKSLEIADEPSEQQESSAQC